MCEGVVGVLPIFFAVDGDIRVFRGRGVKEVLPLPGSQP